MTTPSEQAPSPEISEDMVKATVKLLLIGYATQETLSAIATTTGLPLHALTNAFNMLKHERRMSDGPDLIQRLIGTTYLKKTKYNTPVQIAKNANALYRVAFLLSSARRIAARGKSQIPQERMYWNLHTKACTRRVDAARRVQSVAKGFEYNGMLGWRAVMDERTSAECAAAHGKNFLISKPPVIGYPGTVHPNCRCQPAPVWPGDKMVDDSPVVRKSESANAFNSGAAF